MIKMLCILIVLQGQCFSAEAFFEFIKHSGRKMYQSGLRMHEWAHNHPIAAKRLGVVLMGGGTYSTFEINARYELEKEIKKSDKT